MKWANFTFTIIEKLYYYKIFRRKLRMLLNDLKKNIYFIIFITILFLKMSVVKFTDTSQWKMIGQYVINPFFLYLHDGCFQFKWNVQTQLNKPLTNEKNMQNMFIIFLNASLWISSTRDIILSCYQISLHNMNFFIYC